METEVRSGFKDRRRHRFWKSAAARIQRRKLAAALFLGLWVLAAAGLVILRAALRGRIDVPATLIQLTREAVRGAVRGDLRTAFSPTAETGIEALPEDRYRVTGWVDLITEQGAIQRNSFSCTIYHDPGGAWAAEEVAVLPQ